VVRAVLSRSYNISINHTAIQHNKHASHTFNPPENKI
jgi:hypothetical protein